MKDRLLTRQEERVIELYGAERLAMQKSVGVAFGFWASYIGQAIKAGLKSRDALPSMKQAEKYGYLLRLNPDELRTFLAQCQTYWLEYEAGDKLPFSLTLLQRKYIAKKFETDPLKGQVTKIHASGGQTKDHRKRKYNGQT